MILTSKRVGNTSIQLYYSLGIDPLGFPIIIAKGVQSPRPAFEPIASKIIALDTPESLHQDYIILILKILEGLCFHFKKMKQNICKKMSKIKNLLLLKWEWFSFIRRRNWDNMEKYDVVIVGAGPSGIGMCSMLKDFGVESMTVIDKGKVGETFDKWPEEMRFITPSFTTNFWGHMVKLNCSGSVSGYIRNWTSNWKEYAKYLRTLAEHFELPIKENTEVENVEYSNNHFTININNSPIKSTYLIWAAGEYQYPEINAFSGSQLCMHNSTVKTWKEIKGDDFYVIGGNESGIDAAINLSRMGKKHSTWWKENPDAKITDPSETLTPYTVDRLMDEIAYDRITLVADTKVDEIKFENDNYIITNERDDSTYTTKSKPILATGFVSSLSMVKDLLIGMNQILMHYLTNTMNQEKHLVYFCRSQVRHEDLILCFIYKYRQRFGVVANAIGDRLGMDTSFLDQYEKKVYIRMIWVLERSAHANKNGQQTKIQF